MHYVVTGSTSGTGNAVVARLASKVGAGCITCLVRPTSETRFLRSLGLRVRVGDVTDPESFAAVLSPSVTYLDMTHPKYYPRSLDVLIKAGVKRAYFVTTTGIFSKYHRCAGIYQQGEERIRNSGIAYTILRPSMIYGSLRDKNMHRLIQFLQCYPIFPLFDSGRSLMQPVYVEDLAAGIVSAINNPASEGKAYNLAGSVGIRYRDIVQTTCANLGRRVLMLPVNGSLAHAAVRVLQHIPGFPINDEQVLRLREDKVFDISAAQTDLGYAPRCFEEGISLEIDAMRKSGALPPQR